MDEGHCSGLGPPAGSTTLRILTRTLAMLRHFSHRCRNSLSGIKLGLYLLKRELEDPSHSRWNDLGRTYDEIEKLSSGCSGSINQVVDVGPLTSGAAYSPSACRSGELAIADWASNDSLDPPTARHSRRF